MWNGGVSGDENEIFVGNVLWIVVSDWGKIEWGGVGVM